jgi:phosphoglycolate phosphatase
MREEYQKRWAQKTRPYDGIPELLNALTARNLKMAILSNKPDDMTKAMVTELLSRWKFDHVAGALPTTPKKPDPTMAIAIAKQLDIPVEEFLYLGDTATDMKTARGADMFPVGALWGFRNKTELSEAGAKVLVGYPTEVIRLLW